jgi:hypothetical protein
MIPSPSSGSSNIGYLVILGKKSLDFMNHNPDSPNPADCKLHLEIDFFSISITMLRQQGFRA